MFAGVDIDESDDDPDIIEEASAPEKYELSENVRRRFEFWFSYLEKNRVLKKKEYFPNLLETWLLPQFFVFQVRDFKF